LFDKNLYFYFTFLPIDISNKESGRQKTKSRKLPTIKDGLLRAELFDNEKDKRHLIGCLLSFRINRALERKF